MSILASGSPRRTTRLLARLAALLLLVLPSKAFAQCPTTASTLSGATATLTLCMQVQDVLRMSITSSSTALNNPTTANYGSLVSNAYLTTATALASSAGPTISVTANRAYQVTIAAQSATFGTAPSGVSKPTSDVQWKTASTSFVALSTSGGTMLSGVAANTATSATLSFQSRWAFQRDKPGSYSTTLVITLAGN